MAAITTVSYKRCIITPGLLRTLNATLCEYFNKIYMQYQLTIIILNQILRKNGNAFII